MPAARAAVRAHTTHVSLAGTFQTSIFVQTATCGSFHQVLVSHARHGADGHGCTPQMRVVSKFQGVVTARGGNMGWCQKITRWSQMRTTHESGVYTLGFSARRTQGCTPMSEGWHTPVFFCASGGHHHDANFFFCACDIFFCGRGGR